MRSVINMSGMWGRLQQWKWGVHWHAVDVIPVFLVGFHFMIVLWWSCFTTVIMTLSYVLVCSDSAHGGYESIDNQEHLIQGMWVHEKGQSGQTWQRKSRLYPSIWIKYLQLALIYVNWKKKSFLIGCVLDVKWNARPRKYANICVTSGGCSTTS